LTHPRRHPPASTPVAPLRDSGIHWLGEIPAHWETSKFTWSVFIIEGQVDPEVDPYVNMPLIAPNHVESGTGRLLSTETAADQGAISGKYLCRRGDVIYSKIRPALRKATLAVEDCLCSADMYPLRSREGMQPEFLLLFLLSEPFSTWAVLESNRVAMPKINREALSDIRIPVPPPDEQLGIARHIAEETAKLDRVRAATERT
ncbi:restriction modification system DNA specificity subunit, partial [mine drainage metagenome]